MYLNKKSKTSKQINPKTAKDKRFHHSEVSLHRAIDQALAKRRVGVRGREVCARAKISEPTLYAHCLNVDDALNIYETNIIDEFTLLMPTDHPQHEVIFVLLLNFIRQHRNYFAATLKNHNSWLLTQLIDIVRPQLVSDNINDKCFDLYTGSITTIIFRWYKHENFSPEKIPLYTKKLLQVRVIDIGI